LPDRTDWPASFSIPRFSCQVIAAPQRGEVVSVRD